MHPIPFIQVIVSSLIKPSYPISLELEAPLKFNMEFPFDENNGLMGVQSCYPRFLLFIKSFATSITTLTNSTMIILVTKLMLETI